MYEVKFHTNLDCPKGHWSFPEKVISIPEIGHGVQATNGMILKVCAITHKWRQGSSFGESGPYLAIELTKSEWVK